MDIFEIRELLDSFAAAQAARKYTAADLRQLRSILSAGAKALAKGDIAKLSADNGRFHSKVRDERQRRAHPQPRGAPPQGRVDVRRIRRHRGESSWVEHQALVDAISRGDADGAAEISRQHIAGSRLAYLNLLEQRPALAEDDSGDASLISAAT